MHPFFHQVNPYNNDCELHIWTRAFCDPIPWIALSLCAFLSSFVCFYFYIVDCALWVFPRVFVCIYYINKRFSDATMMTTTKAVTGRPTIAHLNTPNTCHFFFMYGRREWKEHCVRACINTCTMCANVCIMYTHFILSLAKKCWLKLNLIYFCLPLRIFWAIPYVVLFIEWVACVDFLLFAYWMFFWFSYGFCFLNLSGLFVIIIIIMIIGIMQY